MPRSLTCLAFALFLPACAAEFRVKEVDPALSCMPGIPIRVRSSHVLQVFQLQSDGTYKEVFVKEEQLADTQKLYALNFSGDLFTDATVAVELRPDSTLKRAFIKGESKLDEAIGALATQVGEVSDAYAELEAARLEEKQAEIDRAKQEQEDADKEAAERETNLVAYYQATAEAEVALRLYREALADKEVKESQRTNLNWDYRVKAVRANQAAAKVGLPPPYPEFAKQQ